MPPPTRAEWYARYYADPEKFTASFTSESKPSKADVLEIASLVRAHGASGVTSVGAGDGLLEWLLEEHFPCSVVAVDFREGELLKKVGARVTRVVLSCEEDECSARPAISPKHALLFCWGTVAVWKAYLSDYLELGGKCVVVLGDHTCDPSAANEEHDQFFAEAGFENVYKGSQKLVAVWVKRSKAT